MKTDSKTPATPIDFVRDYLFKNFEHVFLLLILVSVALINYYIPYKLAFLNFYFIPVLIAAYYLDVRRALLGAIFCLIMVGIYFWLDPDSFVPGSTMMDIALNISTWGCFLILSCAIVGKLHHKLQDEIRQSQILHGELVASHTQLKAASAELKEYSVKLEEKVAGRTEMLEAAKHTVETLKNKVEETLFSTMDPEVAKLIIEERLRNEKRKISIMFCDLAGFTSYSEEHQPEVVIGDLNNFLGEMEAVIMAYRGHIDKYTGDGLMAEFGAPIDYERHALMAVVAGLKMQDRAIKARFPWKMRIGIATGEPIVGLLGRKRQMYTAIGDAVNLASRIEGVAMPGSVTVEEATYNEVKSFVEATKRTLLPVGEFANQQDIASLNGYLSMLELNPQDADILKKVGFLFLQGNDIVDAHEYFKKALELDPADDKVKLAYADTSIKLEKMGNIAVKGRKRLLRLYEITGLKDPLKDEAKLPRLVYQEYAERVREAVAFPEEIVLPVECLDGSVGLAKVIGFLSFVLADRLGCSEQEKKDAVLGAYLSDIGKAIVPHHLLNRRGGLNKNEFEEVKKHAREGVQMLRKMGFQQPGLLDVVGGHHEYFNGSGYPDGLSGEKISLPCRIVAVAEEYASYVSWRPYRDSWDPRASFAQIEKDTAKGKFDPKIVESLGKVLNFS